MLRKTAIRSLSANAKGVRLFTSSARVMAGGDTGSGFSRPLGQASGDAWTKREKGNEDMYILSEEKKRLLELKSKVAQQKKHLEELDKQIEDITKEQGGEHN